VVKRLDDALRDGDNIRSIIRGSATNQDGKTAGITMPSHDAQVKVIRKAYATAGLDPRHTTYVEAHGKSFQHQLDCTCLISICGPVGTGTKVGDKTEAGALAEAFGRTSSESSTLYIGSVKTNVGHTESTAGLAGLLKASLVLENGTIPPNLNYDKPNASIPWEKYNLKVCVN
jgi:acyl transferase domain-containing protein